MWGLVELNIALPFLCFPSCFLVITPLSSGGFFRWDFTVFPCFLLVSTPLPPVSVVSPLKPEVFAAKLAQHPDQRLVAFVLDGLRNGFRLGFQHSKKLKSAKSNKASANQHSEVIDRYLANEVSLGRVAGPFSSPPFPTLHVSSFGVIPKKGQPGKWRLIVDLSSPGGLSVNDGIDPEEFSMQYITVDQIIRMISSLGVGALIAKFDVEAAYRNIAVHPSDRYLLGMKWRKHYYVDLALPFGLRSAPYIFNSVADMVEWILLNVHDLAALLHYLDDFITAGPPDTNQCAQNLATSIAVCRSLGLPLHPDKCVGPSTRLVVLGIELDSVAQVARLPSDKLSTLQALLQSWRDRRWCTRRDLESLIGHLHHAAKVVWPGRTFLRRMINLLRCFRKRDHPIRLNSEFHLDLQWWLQFLSSWHGVYFWLFPGMSASPDLEVTSDASGSIGFGAFFNGEWFSGSWVASQASHSIAYKELFPVVIAAHVWGPHLARRHVLFRTDNEAVVYILNSRTSKIPVLMRLLRHLLASAARFNFSFASQHVPGVHNRIADALSRFHWQEFRRLAPKAQLLPASIPPQLLAELIGSH